MKTAQERDENRAAKREVKARTTAPGLSFASRKANKDITLFGLILDELRYNNELLEMLVKNAGIALPEND